MQIMIFGALQEGRPQGRMRHLGLHEGSPRQGLSQNKISDKSKYDCPMTVKKSKAEKKQAPYDIAKTKKTNF